MEIQMQSESVKALAEALAKVQAAIKPAKKDTENDFYKKKYADLSAVWEACREPLTTNGLAVTQTTSLNTEGKMLLFTTLMHTSGEWVKGVYPVAPEKATPQQYGSALTYARRYALSAIVGVSQEDDDGNASSGKVTPPARQAAPAGNPPPIADDQYYQPPGNPYFDEAPPYEHDHNASAIVNNPPPAARYQTTVPAASGPIISLKQSQRLWAIANKNKYTKDDMAALLMAKFGYMEFKDVLKKDHDDVEKFFSIPKK